MKSMTMMLVMLCMMAVSMAEDAKELKESKDLNNAKTEYNAQVNAALQPIKTRYLAKLDALKKQLGGQGKIEEAMLVQKEIDAMKKADAVELDESGTADISNLLKGKWTWKDAGDYWVRTVTFEKKGGKLIMLVSDGRKFNVEFKDSKLTVVGDEGKVLEKDPDTPDKWVAPGRVLIKNK